MRTPPHVDTDQEFDTPRSNASVASHAHSIASRNDRSAPYGQSGLGRSTHFPAFADDNDDWATWSGLQITGKPKPKRKNRASTQDRSVESAAFHSSTELPDGRHALLVDPGSVGNLAGAPWIKRAAAIGKLHGLKPTQEKRTKALNVSGVGKGAQTCDYDCTVPICLQTIDQRATPGTFTTPTLGEQELPALLGLKTMMDTRCILDLRNLQLHMCGPEDLPLVLPAGTDSYQLVQAPAGHLMLPCCQYPPDITDTTPEIILCLPVTATDQCNQDRSVEVAGLHED